jgi:endonuclease/exonuclease/phosphatase family metal-dependent hydrolase
LRALSYNIHKGFTIGNRRFILAQIRKALHAIDADLVFLQEVVGEHSTHAGRLSDWPRNSQFEYLAGQLWPHHVYGRNAIYDVGHHGNAILSKYAFVCWENLDISTNPIERRGLLHGVLDAPGQPHVMCIHLDVHGYGRRIQVERICARIAQAVPAAAPLILAGDFNDWRQQSAKRLEEALGLIEVHKALHGRPARTFPCPWPLLRLDRIYVRGYAPVSASCLSGEPWTHLSDHAALVAELA